MPRYRFRAAFLLTASLAAAGSASAQTGTLATAVVDSAIVRMGGRQRLEGVIRSRFELMTQWQRTAFDPAPYADLPSYEWHSDLRDYALRAWRNSRRFASGTGWVELVDVVRDSVAARRSPGGPGGVASPTVATPGEWVPLNVAYVDERDELFAFAPERLLLTARAASDLTAAPDTVVGGAEYRRVRATIDGYPAALLFRRSTGFLAAAIFQSASPNDFGLAPWGRMEVEIWYSSWRPTTSGIIYPHQWDERRVGRPYKRTSVLAAQLATEASPDSFAVSDSVRSGFLATARRPMHDLAPDSARVESMGLVSFRTPGYPAGAVKLGRHWLLLEGGQAPLNAQRAAAWLARAGVGSTLAGALVTTPSTGSGGAAWLVQQRVDVEVAPGASPFVAAVLRGHGSSGSSVRVVTTGRWMRVDGDSIWLEPVDLPDAAGALVAYSPALEWLYSGSASNPVHQERLLALARARGWRVSRVGSARAIAVPVGTSTGAGR